MALAVARRITRAIIEVMMITHYGTEYVRNEREPETSLSFVYGTVPNLFTFLPIQ
jgi:hypothetical protein